MCPLFSMHNISDIDLYINNTNTQDCVANELDIQYIYTVQFNQN